jgi:predicted aminopeptidase
MWRSLLASIVKVSGRRTVLGGALWLMLSQTGCLALDYIPQAAAGQRDLARRARDIDLLVSEGRVDGRLRRLLAQVPAIKRFGERHGLAPTPNYTKYVAVDRPALVWVVSASSPLRFQSRTWSFPFVGSFTYLGWFKRDQADRFAGRLAKEGLDVDVRGAGAYSTAGYFEDPIVSTMIAPGKLGAGELADTLLHEMTHATIFVKYQSTLNESVAMFVGKGLASEYLREAFGDGADETRAYASYERAADQRGRMMKEAYDALSALYASKEPDARKLADKAAIVTALREQIHLKRPINNATLLQYQTYHSGLEDWARLFIACERDWGRFILAVKRLETVRFERPQEKDLRAAIDPLVEARCPR